MGCLWSRLSRQYRSYINTSASGIIQCFVYHSIFVFRFDLLHRRNFPHAHVCVNIDCNFIANSCSLKNLSSLTNFQKLSAVSKTVSIVHVHWKMLCLFQSKLPIAGMGDQFGWRATLRRPRLADRETDFFGGTEFIVPDVLFKTTIAGAPKKHRGYPDMFPSGGLAAALPSNLLINRTKFYTETVLFLCKCTLSSASNSARQM